MLKEKNMPISQMACTQAGNKTKYGKMWYGSTVSWALNSETLTADIMGIREEYTEGICPGTLVDRMTFTVLTEEALGVSL